VVLKAGWLNRQFDQVSRNVETWPDWMKRAAGIGEQARTPEPDDRAIEERRRGEEGEARQRNLEL
jgi:hypothetical protein